MSVKRDLQNAAALLREMGWCQGVFHDGARSCAGGAIMWATPMQVGRASALEEFRRHLGMNIGTWNDAPGRTADEVIAALEAAAEAAP